MLAHASMVAVAVVTAKILEIACRTQININFAKKI